MYLDCKKIIFWLDGYCAKFLIEDFYKTPGRKVINKIEVPSKIKKIYLCGNKSNLQIKYLEKKYNRKIFFLEVPFFKKISDIKNYKLHVDDESLIIINISTPKQEVLAVNILKSNLKKKIYIFCMGGGMPMITGEEKIVPPKIEKLNLEWLWRLQTNTFFRLKRLLTSLLFFLFKKLTNYFSKIEFRILD